MGPTEAGADCSRRSVGEVRLIAAGDAHDVDVAVAIAIADENDALPVW